MSFDILPDETLEDLQVNGLYILQKKDAFRFGIDAVLLSNFIANSIKYKKHSKIVDMGTGTGIIPILLYAKASFESIIGLEIQDSIADMAQRSIRGNNLEKSISIVKGDIRNAKTILGSSAYDIVVSNPPYTKVGSGYINDTEGKAIARHEICCTLMDLLINSEVLLKPQGELYMVHRPDRLADIIDGMRKVKIEPKVLRMVSPRHGKEPSLILIKGIKNGNPGLVVMPELIIYNEDGSQADCFFI